MRDTDLSVDKVVALDVGFAGELGVPVGLGLILAAGLLLAVTKNLSVAVAAVAITVALALTERLPIDVVVGNVRVVDGLLSVAVFGGGNSGKSLENDGNLVNLTKKKELIKKSERDNGISYHVNQLKYAVCFT